MCDDGDVDLIDFSKLAQDWGLTGSQADIAPYTGEIPFITPAPDGIVDILDKNAFTEMWQWYRDSK